MKYQIHSSRLQFLLLLQRYDLGNVQSLSSRPVCQRVSWDGVSDSYPTPWSIDAVFLLRVGVQVKMISPTQSCFYKRGYYSSCLRDESCATRCLTSQGGVFWFVLFLFLLNCLLRSICLWVSVADQLMGMWAKCLSPSADFIADFTAQWFQVWGHFATALESDDSSSMKSQT